MNIGRVPFSNDFLGHGAGQGAGEPRVTMGGQADDVAVQALGGLADGLGDPAGDQLDARGDAARGGLGRDERLSSVAIASRSTRSWRGGRLGEEHSRCRWARPAAAPAHGAGRRCPRRGPASRRGARRRSPARSRSVGASTRRTWGMVLRRGGAGRHAEHGGGRVMEHVLGHRAVPPLAGSGALVRAHHHQVHGLLARQVHQRVGGTAGPGSRCTHTEPLPGMFPMRAVRSRRQRLLGLGRHVRLVSHRHAVARMRVRAPVVVRGDHLARASAAAAAPCPPPRPRARRSSARAAAAGSALPSPRPRWGAAPSAPAPGSARPGPLGRPRCRCASEERAARGARARGARRGPGQASRRAPRPGRRPAGGWRSVTSRRRRSWACCSRRAVASRCMASMSEAEPRTAPIFEDVCQVEAPAGATVEGRRGEGCHGGVLREVRSEDDGHGDASLSRCGAGLPREPRWATPRTRRPRPSGRARG